MEEKSALNVANPCVRLNSSTINLPELPKGWVWTKLRDVISNVSISGKKLKQSEYQQIGRYPVIDQGQIFIGGYTDRDELKITSDTPLIIFGDHTKIFKYVDFPFVVGADGVKVIKPEEIFSPKLFYYFAQAISLPEKGYARHFQWLEKSFIPLPPLNEQKRIVAKIEELFTRLDAGVEALKKIKTQLKRYRQAVLKYAFEGKLTQEWREAHKGELEPASALLEKIKEHRKKNVGANLRVRPNFSTTHLPELPEGWVWTRVEDVFEIIMGQSPPSSTYNDSGNGLPFYQGKLEFGQIYPTPRKWCSLPKKIAEKGDVLISVRAPVGPTNICPERSCIGRGLAAIRPLENVSSLFTLYLMRANQQKIVAQGIGTTFNAITVDQLKNVEIPLPPLPEQHKIVEEIERRFSIADNIEKIVDQTLKQAERLRQSILKRAFEGKLVPQDPTDEPAEKLLERIKAERERSGLIKQKSGKKKK